MDVREFNRLLQSIPHDVNAADVIFKHYFPFLVYCLRREFGNRIDRELIAHDVFYAILKTASETPRGKKPFRYIDNPKQWLRRIAFHRAIDYIRKTHPEISLDEIAPPFFDVDDYITKEDLRRALHKLDDLDRQLIYLKMWEEYSAPELAKKFKLTSVNVRVRLFRAYNELKDILNDSEKKKKKKKK